MRVSLVIVLAVLCAATAVSAHILKLKDGRILRGELVSATPTEIRFHVAGDSVRVFPADIVLSLHFSSATVAPVEQNRPPVRVEVGTWVTVRLQGELNSRTSRAGDKFFAVLDEDFTAGGEVLAPKGKRVFGRVRKVVTAKRSTDNAALEFALTGVPVDGKTRPMITNAFGVATNGRGTLMTTGTARAPDTQLPALADGYQVRVAPGTKLVFMLEQPMLIRR